MYGTSTLLQFKYLIGRISFSTVVTGQCQSQSKYSKVGSRKIDQEDMPSVCVHGVVKRGSGGKTDETQTTLGSFGMPVDSSHAVQFGG